KFKYVTEMNSDEAKAFFLKHESYCNIQLPKYINFEKMLKKIDDMIHEVEQKRNVKSHIKLKQLKSQDDTNCRIYANKDGEFDWRPLEIINPYLYVYLVRYITQKEVWKEILKCFKENDNIKVASIPVNSLTKSEDKKEQILNWWNEVEQESIISALDFNEVIHLDISNCYGSIYTHSIPWAIHGKSIAKEQQNNNELIGNKIDSIIRLMQNNQTNGIPQGSVLMDFIAEIILSYADRLLVNKLKNQNLEYRIIRYRDDYRIFSNKTNNIHAIATTLNDILMGLNFKLNSGKTKFSDEVITSSIKKDKMEYQSFMSSLFLTTDKASPMFYLNLQKHLLQILVFSKKYPNSGSVTRMLDEFHKYRMEEILTNKNNMQCISILTEIMIRNIKATPICIGILSGFINRLSDDNQKELVLNKIIKKISYIPNVDLVNIWLQRLSVKSNKKKKFDTTLCNLISGDIKEIFNNDWIQTKKYKLDSTGAIDLEYIESMDNIIESSEISIFNNY
ncbi:RNA-directed DNA polymerase, partial [Staphylococcus pseudintermedius]|nr:RNA-directed DNA polymerase [Staphylococcus pseudintermedius]